MKNRIIILRYGLQKRTGDPLASPKFGSLDTGSPGLRIDYEENPQRNVLNALSRDQSVLDIATAIPMKLIEPLAGSASAEPKQGKATWGVTAVGALGSPYNGAGITIAVLDTGIDSTHAAFSGVRLEERDFTGSGNGDHDGHVTHCAGTIFGRAIDGRRIGVAPGVERALIGKVIGGPSGGTSDVLIEAVLWAHGKGATVVSMSLGLDFPGFVEQLVQQEGMRIPQATSIALEAYGANVRLFERLTSFLRSDLNHPVVIVAAAGNESGREQAPPFEINVAPPAASPGIVAVAALARGKRGMTVAPFSNARPTISAPGVDILSARSGGGTRTLNGTSMAAPHVAGVAALWAENLKQHRSLTSELLHARLIASGSLRNFAGTKDALDVGSGMVQAPSE